MSSEAMDHRVDPTSRASTQIYLPFFLAGLGTLLTVGCLLGALALMGISLKGSYVSEEWAPYILAHANAQFYGWVGLFVMGFALQNHAPMVGYLKLFYRLAFLSLGLIVLGVVLRFAADPLAASGSKFGLGLGVIASFFEFGAVCLFLLNTSVTRYRDESDLQWPSLFVFAALMWWLVCASAEPLFFYGSHAGGLMESALFMAKWFPAFRDAQFLGFVMMMIFGVAFIKMHECFGFKAPFAKLGIAGLIGWMIGLLARIIGWLQFADSGFSSQSRGLYFAGGFILAASALAIVIALRVFESYSFSIRSHKFIRGALTWLLISGALLALEPIHLLLTRHQFSHAYLGGVRHAITVGVISQMILGVSAHVIANMNDFDVRKLSSLWVAFWLLNIGNAGRVFLEIGSDYSARAFVVIGFTGFIELAGILLWASDVFIPVLFKNMVRAHDGA